MTDRQPKPFVVARNDGREDATLRNGVVAIGNFDGVHRGHRALIDTAIAQARALGRPAAALTFEPHPLRFFRPEVPAFRLTEEAAKLRLLAATGLDGAIVLTFDGSARQSYGRRIHRPRAGRAAGGRRRGDRVQLPLRQEPRAARPTILAAAGAKLGFRVDIVPPRTDGGRRISSGAIRDALAEGRVADAAHLLGLSLVRFRHA